MKQLRPQKLKGDQISIDGGSRQSERQGRAATASQPNKHAGPGFYRFERSMQIVVKSISIADAASLLLIEESHFLDFKSKLVAPSKLSKTISAFANTGGGELYIGIDEKNMMVP